MVVLAGFGRVSRRHVNFRPSFSSVSPVTPEFTGAKRLTNPGQDSRLNCNLTFVGLEEVSRATTASPVRPHSMLTSPSNWWNESSGAARPGRSFTPPKSNTKAAASSATKAIPAGAVTR